MKFTAFGSIIALALIGVVAAAPPNTDANPANPNTQPNSPSTQPKTSDPSTGECIPSNCKTNMDTGSVFCGNEAVDLNCLNGHKFKSTGSGAACDLGLDDSCKN